MTRFTRFPPFFRPFLKIFGHTGSRSKYIAIFPKAAFGKFSLWFLGCKDLNDCEMKKLLNFLEFKNMKESKFGNHTNFLKTVHETKDNFNFMRRGIIGSYKDELSSEQVEKIDKWSQKCLEEYGISESDIFGIL